MNVIHLLPYAGSEPRVLTVSAPLVSVRGLHSSWNDPDALRTLADFGIGFCNIDQPVMGNSLKPTAQATSAIGYVRLHGRNYQNWFAVNRQSHERYEYLYSVKELKPWVGRFREYQSGRRART